MGMDSSSPFILGVAVAAAKAPFADLGTSPLGWIVALGTPFGVLFMKAWSAPKGTKWALIDCEHVFMWLCG